MPKVDIDDIIKKLLEHSSKYPELETYAYGLKEIYRLDKENDAHKTKKPKEELTLTKNKPVGRINKIEDNPSEVPRFNLKKIFGSV